MTRSLVFAVLRSTLSLRSLAVVAALLVAVSGGAAEKKPKKEKSTVADPGIEGDGDFILGPDYAKAPEMSRADNVPKGDIKEFTMQSTESKIYPGIKGPYLRKVWVYIPKQYVAGTPAPFIIVQDGGGYVGRMSTALDNLIAAKKVPTQIAILLDSGGGDSKGSERGLEYDNLTDAYVNFIESEVLPRVAKDYKLTFTSDPEGRASMGGSSGGACAFTMGWFRPDLYRRILTYSGTFVAQESPDNPKSPHGAWEYHEHFIPMSEPKPLRVWLQVGENDNGHDRDEKSYHNWVMANQRMAAVMKAKGYHYHYDFCKGAGHVDGKVLDQTLPGALEWLWRGYPIK
jgi:iron(III)-enterobactin esterase